MSIPNNACDNKAKMEETILAAGLSRYANYYNVKFFSIAEKYGSLQNLYTQWKKKDNKLRLPQDVAHALENSWREEKLQAQRQLLEQFNIQAIQFTDKRYPQLLGNIPDKPYVLYVRGNLPALSLPIMLSCVGTRKITTYGKQVIPLVLKSLSGLEACVVSGLAFGVDAFVHTIALRYNLATVAVLGGGLDKIEPQTNQALGEAVRHSGCLASEYPPGVRPQKHHFLERNRIIAGLAHATIVVEGGIKSGALVTARQALAYGREVGAVPGSIHHPTSEAPHMLLRDGAWPIMGAEDVKSMLNLPQLSNVQTSTYQNSVHIALSEGAASADELANKLGLSMHELQAQITELELADTVSQSATGAYYLKYGR